MQDHVYDGAHIGERLLLFAIEGARLQRFQILRTQIAFGEQVVVGFAQEACRAARAIINLLADLRLHSLHHGANLWAGRSGHHRVHFSSGPSILHQLPSQLAYNAESLSGQPASGQLPRSRTHQ
jgi:hypothetical protein